MRSELYHSFRIYLITSRYNSSLYYDVIVIKEVYQYEKINQSNRFRQQRVGISKFIKGRTDSSDCLFPYASCGTVVPGIRKPGGARTDFLFYPSVLPASFRCNRIFILYRDGISVCPDRKYAVLRVFSVYFQHYIFTDELFHNNVSRNPDPGFGSDDHGNCDECGRQL